MIEFVKKLLWDESAFERYARAAIMFTAIYLPSVDALPPWVTAIGAALAVFIGAGDKNK